MDYETLKDILMFAGLCISNIGTWFFARRKQNNDFLAELQKSIDLLTAKYTKALDENVALKEDNANLRSEKAELLENQRTMTAKIDVLTRKVDSLTKQLKNYEKNNQGYPPYVPALARNDLSGIMRSDQGDNFELREGNRGVADQRKCRTSGRGRTRRAAGHATAGTDGVDDNDAVVCGSGSGADEFIGDPDSEPP